MSPNRKKILRYSIASMAKKMSHLMLLVGGLLLFILFFVMVTGKKEGFRPPGPPCINVSSSFETENESQCSFQCLYTSATGRCLGYYNQGMCECYLAPEKKK